MSQRTRLGAWTAPDGYKNYPKSVNFTSIESGQAVEIIVRSPEDLGSVIAACRIPADDFVVLLTEVVLRHLVERAGGTEQARKLLEENGFAKLFQDIPR